LERQTVAGGAIAGSSRAFRLDPHTLPARCSPPSGEAAGLSYVIERERTTVRRPTPGGPVTLSVPVDAYRGVAVRMEPLGGEGAVTAFVELLHADPSLTLQLAVTDDPYAIAGDWQAWGRTLDLPLLIVGQDGSVSEPLAGPGVLIAPTKPRRRHSYFAARRPRFLTRRKTGRLELMIVTGGREIIARD
jgi:hypothetical protein